MANASRIYAIADSYFVLHLLAPGEADIPSEGGEATSLPLPENLVEDFVDEACEMVDELSDRYSSRKGWEESLVRGFIDGMLAVAEDRWTDLEDTYIEDSRNPEFSAIDEAIDQMAADFDGMRPWDETAKGYARTTVADVDGGFASLDEGLLAAASHAFIYGAESAYEQEWKFYITPADNIIFTDEDSIGEAALAQYELESGSGSLVDRVLGMMGIDLDELAEAIGMGDDEDEDEDGFGEDDGEGVIDVDVEGRAREHDGGERLERAADYQLNSFPLDEP